MLEILEIGKYIFKEMPVGLKWLRKPEIFQINNFLIKRRLLTTESQRKITTEISEGKMEFSKGTENYWGVAKTDCPIGSE